MRHCVQSHVVLDLPLVHEDADLAVYEMTKSATVADHTRDHASRRDRRRDQ